MLQFLTINTSSWVEFSSFFFKNCNNCSVIFHLFWRRFEGKTETSTWISLPNPRVLLFHLVPIPRDYKSSTLFTLVNAACCGCCCWGGRLGLQKVALACANTFSGSVVSAPSGAEGLPKVCCRRASRFGHLCSQCSSVCGSSLHSGHVGSAAGSTKWAYALRSGVCPARRRARRTTSALLEVAMQAAFQENCSYTMAVWGLLDGGSVTVRRMSAFAEANEMGRGGVSVAAAAILSPIRRRPRCLVCLCDLERRWGWWGLPCCLVAGE